MKTSINQSLECARVYPAEGTTMKQLSDLDTVVLILTPEQAAELAAELASEHAQSFGAIKVVAFREPKKNGNHRLAIRGEKDAPPFPKGKARVVTEL